jgi:hypothetical protein
MLAARVYGDPKLVPALEQLLRHANVLVRYGSVTALEAFTPKNYRKGFLPLIADKEPLVRRAAVRGQGKTVIGTSELSGIEPIVLRLGDAVEDVRSAAIAAILAIGAPAVPVLKEHVHSKDSWLRAGVLVCLAQLAEVSDIGQLNTFSGDTTTIQITREIVTANDHSNSLVALDNAWIETIRARKIVRQVHFVFQPPSDEEYRRAIRRWVSELDHKFPQITCILTDQALSAWLKLLLPDRKDKVQENQTSDEPAGGGSRAGLLLDLVERSRGASREICKTNWFRRRRTERELNQ